MSFMTILTISICASFLLTTVVPASIRIKRDNEIFDDYFLPGHSIQLSVPARAQTLQFTCGPTVAFVLLQFLGYRSLSTSISNDLSGDLCTDGLIMRMDTEPYSVLNGGTTITNFVNTINSYIRNSNLNNLREYHAIQLNPSILNQNANTRIDYTANFWRIARFVYNSLANRAPVVLGFHGRFSGFEQIRSHFILISGITITDNGATFHYMDPDGGRHSSFAHHQLNHLLQNGGFLVAHFPTPSGPPSSGNKNSKKNCPESAAFGGVAGMTGGIIAGAVVGSAVPGIGTFIGGIVGAMTGLVGGSVGSGATCALA